MQRREVNQPIYILRSTPFKETSLRLDVFSKKYGRVHLIAKGARKSKTMKKLHLFKPYLFSWYGAGDLKTVYSWEECEDISRLSLYGNYLKFYSYCYVNELLLKTVLQHEPFPILYNRYEQMMQIDYDEGNIQKHLLVFEFILLQQIGYGLSFRSLNFTIPNQQYRYMYIHDQGFQELHIDNNLQSDDCIDGKTLLCLKNKKYSSITSTQIAKARKLLGGVIDSHCQNHEFKVKTSFLSHEALTR